MKQNRAMRPSKKSKFKSNNRSTIYSGNNSENKTPQYNKASKEKLEEIKSRVQKEAKIEKKKNTILIISHAVVVLMLLLFILK